MDIPIINVKENNAALAEEILAAVSRVIRHGQYILGPSVESFEAAVADRLGVGHVVAVNSGTDALWLTLKALAIGPGDEVITTPNTFVATVAAIHHAGAIPCLVDVGDDENLDPVALADAVGPRTRAVIAVHLRGRPARMREIAAIAERNGLVVIEDASQAFGATLDGVPAGRLARAGCFSLHPQKILGACGDAGMVTTDDGELAASLRLLRNHGLMTRDSVATWGFNSRLDPLQAEILRMKLRHIDATIARHRRVAARYHAALAGLPLRLPREAPAEHCVYYHYSIMSDRRDALREFLRGRGIDASVHYPTPIHRQPAARGILIGRGGVANCERQACEQLSLPIYAHLTDIDVLTIVNAVRAFHREPALEALPLTERIQ
ncbi:MAG: DegT/DnrJ/EryC1/StrS family aminotransferase [Alphaproteobacteria bacterium]|nr:MAG: DegT/DnrJ/EryC1/StrS family aminotransferase [Alphaproteobacteria bacterium]